MIQQIEKNKKLNLKIFDEIEIRFASPLETSDVIGYKIGSKQSENSIS